MVDYSGAQPQVFTDPDDSIEGWIPGCFTPAGGTRTCNSFFVVGEPIGSQAWFPSNNYPTEKATFDTEITVPSDDTAFAAGELVGNAPAPNGDGTSTWRWSEDDPSATYLMTASNGDFDYEQTTVFERITARTLPIYTAIDSSGTPTQKATVKTTLGRTGEMMNFLAERYGPYPFDSNGALVDRTTGIGYALEVQGKSHYPGNNNGPSVGRARCSMRSRTSGSATAPRLSDGATFGSTRDGPSGPHGCGISPVASPARSAPSSSSATTTTRRATRIGRSRRRCSMATRPTCSTSSRLTCAGR